MEVYEDYLSRRIVHTCIKGILVDSMMSSELFRWLFLKSKKKVRARNKKGKKCQMNQLRQNRLYRYSGRINNSRWHWVCLARKKGKSSIAPCFELVSLFLLLLEHKNWNLGVFTAEFGSLHEARNKLELPREKPQLSALSPTSCLLNENNAFLQMVSLISLNILDMLNQLCL